MGRIQKAEKKTWLRLVSFESKSSELGRTATTVVLEGAQEIMTLRDALVEAFPLSAEQLQALVAQRTAQELAP